MMGWERSQDTERSIDVWITRFAILVLTGFTALVIWGLVQIVEA